MCAGVDRGICRTAPARNATQRGGAGIRGLSPGAPSQSKRLSATTRRFSCGRHSTSDDLHHRVLQVGGNDLEVFLVEDDEFQLVHGGHRAPALRR